MCNKLIILKLIKKIISISNFYWELYTKRSQRTYVILKLLFLFRTFNNNSIKNSLNKIWKFQNFVNTKIENKILKLKLSTYFLWVYLIHLIQVLQLPKGVRLKYLKLLHNKRTSSQIFLLNLQNSSVIYSKYWLHENLMRVFLTPSSLFMKIKFMTWIFSNSCGLCLH